MRSRRERGGARMRGLRGQCGLARAISRPPVGSMRRSAAHKYNQGDGLRMALEIGAMPWGQWSGCHATPINAEAPAFGDRQLTDKTNRLSYLVWRDAQPARACASSTRARIRRCSLTPSSAGRFCNQPGGVAWQIFDAKVTHLLEPRYSTSQPVDRRPPRRSGRASSTSITKPRMRTLDEFNSRGGSRQLQSRRARRHGDARARAAEIQLGAENRYAAVLSRSRSRAGSRFLSAASR